MLALQGLSSSIPLVFFNQVYYHLGGLDIKMVPIYHTSAQSLWYVYFHIIADYLDFTKSLLGVTRSPTRNLCTESGIYFLRYFCCSIFTVNIFIGKKSLLFSNLPIENNAFARHRYLLVLCYYL